MFVTQKNSCSRSDQERRQRKTCYKFRPVFVLFLALVMFVTSVIPAHAADLPATAVVNLMEGSIFYLIKNGNRLDTEYFSPTTWQSTVSSLGYYWEFDNNTIFTNLFFTIYVDYEPDCVQLYGNDAVFVGSNGKYYTYKYSRLPSHDYIELIVYFDQKVSTAFHLVSAYGCVENAENISNVNVQYGTYVVELDSVSFEDTHSVSNVSVPYSCSHVGSYPPGYKTMSSGDVRITVTPDQRDTDFAESASCVVGACYSLRVDECSAQIYKDGKVIAVPDVIISKQTPSSTLITGDYQYSILYYQMTADLRGYDLTDCYVTFSFSLDGTLRDEVNGYAAQWHFNMNSLWFQPVYDESDGFFAMVKQRLNDIYHAMTKGFSDLQEALRGNNAAQEAINQASQNMDAVSSSMSEANSQLNSVEKPSLDTGQLFGDILQFDTGGLVVLSAITSNPYVTSVMVVVFTFALCGYVFFGKKG